MQTIKIDKRIKTPYYKQIIDSIRASIESGALRQGDLLPGNKDIAAYFEISEIVARSAYNQLEAEGIIEKIQGKGTFVKTRPVITIPLSSLYDTASIFQDKGLQYDRSLKLIEKYPNYIFLKTIDTADGYVVCHQTWKIYHAGDKLLAAIADQMGTFELYQALSERPIHQLANTIYPRSATQIDAVLMKIKEKSPLYFIRSKMTNKTGFLLLEAESVFTAEYLKFEVTE